MNNDKIIIIGAGISGLACATELKAAGLNPVILDKGRGIGGRLATRRTDTGLQFDHGAQYATARTEDFQNVLSSAECAGQVANWEIGDRVHSVGTPGMNGLAKFLSKDIDVRQLVQITAIREVTNGCEFTIGTERLLATKLVVTVPAPQAIGLLGEQHPFADELANVAMLPSLTLMAAFKPECTAPFTARRDFEAPLSWIAHDSSKPGRTSRNCWVAQASSEYSLECLEEAPSRTSEHMLPLLCDSLGFQPSDAIHVAAHRWRYAAVSRPLGRPFMRNLPGTLYLGGDWCLDARIEAAWCSGRAIAADILKDT